MNRYNKAFKIISIGYIFLFMFLFFVPSTHADEANSNVEESYLNNGYTLNVTDESTYPAVIDETVNIKDPDLSDITMLGLSAIRFMVGFAGGFTILMLVYAGFQYITGYMTGSEEGSNQGKTTMFHAIIGLILILTSYLIVTMFQSALTSMSFN